MHISVMYVHSAWYLTYTLQIFRMVNTHTFIRILLSNKMQLLYLKEYDQPSNQF